MTRRQASPNTQQPHLTSIANAPPTRLSQQPLRFIAKSKPLPNSPGPEFQGLEFLTIQPDSPLSTLTNLFEMAIAPIVGKLKRGLIIDLSLAIGFGTGTCPSPLTVPGHPLTLAQPWDPSSGMVSRIYPATTTTTTITNSCSRCKHRISRSWGPLSRCVSPVPPLIYPRN